MPLPPTSVKMKSVIYTQLLLYYRFPSRCIRLLLGVVCFLGKTALPSERCDHLQSKFLQTWKSALRRSEGAALPGPPQPCRRSGARGCRHRPAAAPRGPARGGGSPPAPVPMAAGGWLCLDVPAPLQDGNSGPPRGGSSGCAL